MERKSRKLIVKALNSYPTMFSDCAKYTLEWAESNMAIDYGKVCVQSSPSNFKETRLCALIDTNEKKLRWCYVVEKVLDHYKFENDKTKFIDLHFFKKQGEIKICNDVGIGRATFFRWENKVIETAYEWAKHYGLLREQQ